MYILLSTYWICISFSFQLGSEGWFHSCLLIPSRPFAFYSVHYYLYALCSQSNLNIPLVIAHKWWIICPPSKNQHNKPCANPLVFLCVIMELAVRRLRCLLLSWEQVIYCTLKMIYSMRCHCTAILQQKDMVHPQLLWRAFPCSGRALVCRNSAVCSVTAELDAPSLYKSPWASASFPCPFAPQAHLLVCHFTLVCHGFN